MWPYDSDQFEPPAPVLEAVLMMAGGVREPLRMQVDSGADLSCIPEALVPVSGGLRHGVVRVAGYDGTITMKKTCFVAIRFGEHRFDNVEVLPIPDPVGLIGRDLLNTLEVTLDGPAQRLFIQSR